MKRLLALLACAAVAVAQTTPPPPSDTPPAPPALNRLLNLSTRGLAGTGEQVLIGGLVLEREAQVLIRAVGPGLAAFGITGTATSVELTLFQGAASVGSNRRWGDGDAAAIAAAATAAGAFPLQAGSADACLLVTLAPGSYTAQVAPYGAPAGVALLEIYVLP